MIDKHIQQTTVIGGDDGPVSIFIAGKSNDYKKPLKNRLKNKIYQLRRKRAEKKNSARNAYKRRNDYLCPGEIQLSPDQPNSPEI